MICCPECITKIKDEENGQHRDCDICTIKEIEKSKKIKLNENIKCLEELSINLENSINKLKILFENMNNEKENLKLKIQKIFTKLRSDLNNREDELLLEIDKKNESFISDDIIKNGEKLPNKIKKSLEKGKLLKDLWGKNKLHSLINDCLNIENNINEIKKINNNIKSCNSR